MQTYRADEPDALALARLLTQENLPFDIERFGPSAIYVTVTSTRPDISKLARYAGRSVRPVLALDQIV